MKTSSSSFTKLIVLTIYFCYSFTLKAQTPPQFVSDSLQAILNRALPTNFPQSGCIMRIESPGQWIWEGAVGSAIAGITSGQPQTVATPQHQFRVGSITKMMVATCILKLEQQGLLNINDAINFYLRPTLVNDTIAASDTVRIRHLLNHTSGIDNSANNTSCQMNVLSNLLASHSLEEAVYCGASQGEIATPGLVWAYSNTNYSLLAMIIEKVTGMSYQQYITQNLFIPLNLNNTFIPTTPQISPAHMGCYWNLGTWTDLTVINATAYTGWADIVSTTADLIKFYKELKAGNIINNTELTTMYTIDPASFGYGMGLDFWTFSGTSYVGHYGEVANTSGLFFGNITSPLAPNGFYISYNFNIQGADMQVTIDNPVIEFLKNTTTGVKENKLTTFNVYPNPTKDFIYVNIGKQKINELYVMDLFGKKVFGLNEDTHDDVIKISLEKIEKGIYFLAIKTNEGIQTQKIIVE